MREAWRLEKVPLEKALHEQGKQLAIVFIYVGNELPTFDAIQLSVQSVLKKIPFPTDSPQNDEVSA